MVVVLSLVEDDDRGERAQLDEGFFKPGKIVASAKSRLDSQLLQEIGEKSTSAQGGLSDDERMMPFEVHLLVDEVTQEMGFAAAIFPSEQQGRTQSERLLEMVEDLPVMWREIGFFEMLFSKRDLGGSPMLPIVIEALRCLFHFRVCWTIMYVRDSCRGHYPQAPYPRKCLYRRRLCQRICCLDANRCGC